MKIAVISAQVFPVPCPGYSGLEMIAYHCAKGLAERGHQVALIAPDGSQCPGCQVIHTGPAGTFDERKAYGGHGDYKGYWQVLPQMDCVIDHSWAKHSYLLKQEGVLKAPILGVCHAPIQGMFKSPPPVDKPCMVCISEDQANTFKGLFNRKAEVCYNGIDTIFYRPIGLPRSDRFLFLARFSTIKGPDLAIDMALATGYGLDLIGDTSITNEPEYYNACKKKCDNKQIKMIGSVSRGECVWWFSQAKALAHCNMRFQEPFGLAPVEAMAAGCGVLCYDNGAMRETVVHGETGFLVNTPEEMIDLVKTNALDSIDRIKCVERAKRFSVEIMSQRYEELCLQALKSGW